MEFLLMSLAGLMLLALASALVVEGAFLFARIYSRLSFWLRYRHLSWRSARQVSAWKRRYGPRKGRSPSPFGRLRFTRSRGEQFGKEPPDIHGEG